MVLLQWSSWGVITQIYTSLLPLHTLPCAGKVNLVPLTGNKMTSCVETIDLKVTVHDEFVVTCDLLDGSEELLSLHSIIIMLKKTRIFHFRVAFQPWGITFGCHYRSAKRISLWHGNVLSYQQGCHLFTRGIGKSFSPRALFHIG